MVTLNPARLRPGRLIDLQAMRFRRWEDDFSSSYVKRSLLRDLSEETGIYDFHLLNRLLELGFTDRNIAALPYVALAEVAWASGSVTDSERVRTVGVILNEDLIRFPEASELFRSWLSDRPDSKLIAIWPEFVRQGIPSRNRDGLPEFGSRLYQIATAIAEASGDLLAPSSVCPAERAVLAKIRSVYLLDQ